MKQRLVGAAVLMALGVIFIPILLAPDDTDEPAPSRLEIDRSPSSGQFSSKVQPINDSELKLLEEQSERIVPLAGSGQLPPEVDTFEPAENTEQIEQPSAGEVETKLKDSAAPKQERAGVSAWVVQAGSFSSRENAEKLASQLKAKGFSAYIEDIVADKPAYRVRIGPLLSKARAQQTAKSLKNSLDVDGMIVKYH